MPSHRTSSSSLPPYRVTLELCTFHFRPREFIDTGRFFFFDKQSMAVLSFQGAWTLYLGKSILKERADSRFKLLQSSPPIVRNALYLAR